eukprot:328944_1
MNHTADDEKKEATLSSDYNNRWGVLTSLVESTDDRLNCTEKEHLTNLLQCVENIQHFQNQNANIEPSELGIAFPDDDEKQYELEWFSLMRVICLICLSSFSFGYITIQTSSIIHDAKGHQGLFYYTFDHMNHVQKTILSSSSLIGATIGCFMIFAYSS